MPSLWSEVQLTYVLIMTVFLGIFRAIDIGLHSRDLHTAQSAHSAVQEMQGEVQLQAVVQICDEILGWFWVVVTSEQRGSQG